MTDEFPPSGSRFGPSSTLLRTKLVIGALVALTVGCASLRSSKGSPDDLVYARLLSVADSRAQDTTFLDSVLASPDPVVRANAALVVGQLRMKSRAPRLRELLHSDTATAANAAFALGLLKDTASANELGTALSGPTSVAVEAAWALGEIGARDIIESRLFQLMETPARETPLAAPPDSRLTVAVLLAAARLRPLPTRQIVMFFGDGADSVSWAATYAVSRTRTPAATKNLLELAGAPSALVRANVARGLAMGSAGDSLAGPAGTALLTLVTDREPHVRINAVRSLASYGPRHIAAVMRVMRDPDANVRIAAAQSLPGTSVGISDTAWRSAWSADTGLAFRQSLLSAAARVGHVLPGLTEWSRSADWRLRASVADAASAAADPKLIDSLASPLLTDSDVRVRARAFGALSGAIDSIPTAMTRLRAALNDLDPDVRAAAVDALGEGRANAAEVPRILTFYSIAKRDTSNVARVAALGYIAAAWRRDSVRFDPALRASLAALPEPADPEERLRVAGVSPFSHWKGVAGTPRPLSWYEKRHRDLVRRGRNGRLPVAEIVTNRGSIRVTLFAMDAPLTVDNFVTLARSGYYRDVRFHRVVPNFVAQAGDPTGTGGGGPGYAIRDELNRRRYRRGTLGMALSGPDTGGSQWFITHSPQPHLDGGYTVFGQVTAGWDVLDALVQGDRIIRITVR